MVAGLYGLGLALSYPLGIWPGVHPLDHPEPWPARIALASSAILIALVTATAIGARTDRRAALLVNWLVLAVLAVASAALLSGASYAFVWPALAVALFGWAETLLGRKSRLAITTAAGFAAIAFFWLAHFLALEAVLGFASSQFKLLALAPFALALSPVFMGAGRSNVAAQTACLLVAAVASFAGARAPAYSPDHPRPTNFIYYDDRAAQGPRWLVLSNLPQDEAFLKSTGFSAEDEEFLQLGLIKAKGRFKPATALNLATPTLTVAGIATRDGLAVLTGTLRSASGGFAMGLGVAPGSGVRSLRVEGQDLFGAKRLRGKDPSVGLLFGLATREVAVEIVFDPKAPAKIVLFERSPLPDADEARALIAARPKDAAPAHSGDGALVAIPIDLATLKPGP
jgi:hypothetical protein